MINLAVLSSIQSFAAAKCRRMSRDDSGLYMPGCACVVTSRLFVIMELIFRMPQANTYSPSFRKGVDCPLRPLP